MGFTKVPKYLGFEIMQTLSGNSYPMFMVSMLFSLGCFTQRMGNKFGRQSFITVMSYVSSFAPNQIKAL